jgi:hypothetical protein
MGFIKDALVYKVNAVNAICPKMKLNQKIEIA